LKGPLEKRGRKEKAAVPACLEHLDQEASQECKALKVREENPENQELGKTIKK
jgi:hypothetical protein